MNPPELNKNEREINMGTVNRLESISFEIQSTFNDSEIINKILKNISKIKECYWKLGEPVEGLNISELEHGKYLDGEAIDSTYDLYTPTSIGTDTQECVDVEEKMFQDGKIIGSKSDSNVSVKKCQSDTENHASATKKKKRNRKKRKRRKFTHGNANITTDHCPNASQINNLKEQTCKNEGEILDEKIRQIVDNSSDKWKNKSHIYEVIEPINKLKKLLINEFTQNMNYILEKVTKLNFEIEECFKHENWDDFADVFDSHVANTFIVEATDSRCDTEFVSNDSSTVQENQSKVENICFKGSTEIPSSYKISTSDDSEKQLSDDYIFGNLIEDKTNDIGGEYRNVTEDKNPKDDELSNQSEIAEQIPSVTTNSSALSLHSTSSKKNLFESTDKIIHDVQHRNQSEDEVKFNSDHVDYESLSETAEGMHANVGNENKPKGTKIIPSDTQKENYSEDTKQISYNFGAKNGAEGILNVHLADIGQEKPRDDAKECISNYSDKGNQSQPQIQIPLYYSHKSQCKVSEKSIYDVEQEHQSNVPENIHPDDFDYECLSETGISSNHVRRAIEIHKKYEYQNSVIMSLGAIPENFKDYDLEVALKTFSDICKDAGFQTQKVIKHLFGIAEVDSKIWFSEECTDKSKQHDIKQDQAYQKMLKELQDCYKELEESFRRNYKGSESPLNLIDEVNKSQNQDPSEIMTSSILLQFDCYGNFMTLVEFIQKYKEYRNLLMKMKEL